MVVASTRTMTGTMRGGGPKAKEWWTHEWTHA